MTQLETETGSGSRRTEKASVVKTEMEDDTLQEEYGPLHKRHRSAGVGGFSVPPSEYNPLDEPSPLGLRLKKSPSLLDLIQMKLIQASATNVCSESHQDINDLKAVAVYSGDKLKASNFPGSVLRIGSWEYKSRYEGDLVAKCYFAKHKLVWEVLDGGLKNKIEIQWSDIMALKASYPNDSPGTLDVVLFRQPLFFRETNPQPRKHTLWQATSDFTGGQASIHRRHHLECPQGLLGKHFEKLVQCDPRLHFLSQQDEITLDSPFFDPKVQVFDDQNHSDKDDLDLIREDSPSLFSCAQSSSSKYDVENFISNEASSPSSGHQTLTMENMKESGFEQLKEAGNWDQIMVPGLRSSMSMTDLVSHLEHRLSEQGASSYPNLSTEDWQSLQILDDINRCLFSDFQSMPPDMDNKSLMTRVNSLCCLLQKDPAPGSNPASSSSTPLSGVAESKKEQALEEGTSVLDQAPSSSISRKDSVGELLMNLPRIASLPQFLFNISEDFESQAR